MLIIPADFPMHQPIRLVMMMALTVLVVLMATNH